jgi:predicted ester cyclase
MDTSPPLDQSMDVAARLAWRCRFAMGRASRWESWEDPMQQVEQVHTPTEERNLAVVRRMYACWNSGDPGFVDEFISPDVVNHALPPGSPPGRDSFVWLYEVYRAAFADTSDELQELLADGDTVIGRVRHRGRHVGEFFGVPATGRQVECTDLHLATGG